MSTLTRSLLVLGCLAMPLTAARAAVAPSDDEAVSVEVRILDVLLERGLIDEATYEELMALAAAEKAQARELDMIESRLQRLAVPDVKVSGGKPGKLLVESDDGKWSMGFKGRIQVQVDKFVGEDGNRSADETNFSVRRARLALFGNAGGEDTTYKLEFDAPTQNKVNSGPKDFSLTDAYVDWGLGDRGPHVQAGQFKYPFGREVQAASSKIDLVDESLASNEFAPDREPGVMMYGATDESFFEWYGAMSNGQGTGISNSEGEAGSGSDGLRTGVRLVLNPLGKVERDLAAFQTVDNGGVLFAIGGSWMVNADQGQDLNGDGVDDSHSNDTSIGLESQLLVGPASFLAESFRRDSDVAGGPNVDDTGYNAQVGVFLVPSKFEVVVRRSAVDLDDGDDTLETTLGVNFYLDKHNSKFAFDITKVDNQDSPDSDEMQYRGQYQIVF